MTKSLLASKKHTCECRSEALDFIPFVNIKATIILLHTSLIEHI